MPAPPDARAPIIDAAIVVSADAAVGWKPPAKLVADCKRVAKRIGMGHSKEETRDDNAAIIELCTRTPWPAGTIECVLTAKEESPQYCADELPADMKAHYDERMLDIYKTYNDYVPPGLPLPPELGGSDSL